MFLLDTVTKDYIWGGGRLKADYGKAGGDVVAESWELSVHPDGCSVIGSGEHNGMNLADYLATHHGAAGEGDLPVLCKLIDAARPLSVQVHPDDAYAMRKAGSMGKTEFWHILGCEPGAFLYLGVKRRITREELSSKIEDNTIEEILNKVPVQPGESYYIPAGMLHAIGAGITLYEVQESSNLTYRVYDYGRLGADGKPRQLHIEDALEVASLCPVDTAPIGAERLGNGEERLVRCPYFTLDRIELDGEKRIKAEKGSFLHIICTDGGFTAENKRERLELSKGRGLFMEAGEGAVLRGSGCVLCTSRGGKYAAGLQI